MKDSAESEYRKFWFIVDYEAAKEEQVGNRKLSASGMRGFVDFLFNNIRVHDCFISV